jgi:glycerol kinase
VVSSVVAYNGRRMPYILSLDQGTTSSRAILFDQQGKNIAHAQHEFEQRFPDAGWVEHDPYDILTSQLTAAVEVMTRAGIRPRDVVALGITNQRETAIVWDRETGKPIYNAIVWQDRRMAALCGRLRDEGSENMVREKTGLLLDSYFSGTKVAWILDNVQGARQRAEAGKLAFGTVDSWLIWNLTSGKRHVTDQTNASRTLLFNIVEGRWDTELLRLLKIPESMMPEVVWSSDRIGEVTTTLGLGSIAIAGVAGDQQSALFGQLCFSPGDAKNTYGTGCFLLQHIGDRFVLSQNRLITTLVCSLDRKLEYALEGSIFIGGAVVQWLRDNLGIIRKSADVEALAASVTNNGGVVFVPAFVGLGAPHWDPYARGLLIGLERGTHPGHIARAALESIACQVADVMEAMNKETPNPFRELRVDGGASANDLLMQSQADITGIPVMRPEQVETTALGAAYLAGLATGFWESPQQIQSLRGEGTRFTPNPDRSRAQRQRAQWREAVSRARDWANPDNASRTC